MNTRNAIINAIRIKLFQISGIKNVFIENEDWDSRADHRMPLIYIVAGNESLAPGTNETDGAQWELAIYYADVKNDNSQSQLNDAIDVVRQKLLNKTEDRYLEKDDTYSQFINIGAGIRSILVSSIDTDNSYIEESPFPNDENLLKSLITFKMSLNIEYDVRF